MNAFDRKTRSRLPLALLRVAALCALPWITPALAFVDPVEPFVAVPTPPTRLNENCIVSVLNRNVQVASNGTWVLPNIPANFGQVRARATCVQDGVTRYGESDPFVVPANQVVSLPAIYIGGRTPIPTALRLVAPTTVLTSPGAIVQLQAMALFPGSGTEVDVTATGTTYSISNPTIATITPGGRVTAVRSGTVVVQALKEGTPGVVMLRVLLSGADADGDGIPDADEVRLGMDPTNAADAALDQDHDGLTALQEYQAGTDPRNADTDSDTIGDGDEVGCVRGGFCTNPLLADTDGDGVRDATEIATGSNPTNPASFNLQTAVSSLRVTPAAFSLTVNSMTGTASVQLNVIGTMIDGFEINLTSTTRQTTYESNNLASCNFGSPDGRVFASTAGSCVITVRNNGRSVQVNGTVRNFTPSMLSFLRLGGSPNGVAVTRDHAFVASGGTGLQVIALSADRRTPSLAGSLSFGSASANDVALVGNTAYLATSNGLRVVNVATPTAPQLIGSYTAVGGIMGVKVVGTTAYVVGGTTLSIINVANPAGMSTIGSLNLGSSSTGWNVTIDVTRNLAAVAMGTAGLKLVDISNLSAPVLLGTAATGNAQGAALRGNTAIVADYDNSMTSVDITDLAAPVILNSTPMEFGGRLTNVVLSDDFALGSDVFFVNGVPIVDVSNPAALAPRTVLNFPPRDDNGMNIAVDNGYVYMVGDRFNLARGGTFGDGGLYIGQFQPPQDSQPPVVAITAPTAGQTYVEGDQIFMSVNATDDTMVEDVRFLVNGTQAFVTSTAPYEFTFTAPSTIGALVLGATARDVSNNEGTAPNVNVAVVADPGTRVVGVVFENDDTPAAGAVVTTNGGRTGTTGVDGSFQIDNVPTSLGDIVARAEFTMPNGSVVTASSEPAPPIRGGTTSLNGMTLMPLRFIFEFGNLWTSDADVFTQRTLPFTFPFYGQGQTSVFVGSNGYVTFGSGDTGFSDTVTAFKSFKRIAAFMDHLWGGRGSNEGGVFIDDTVPDRFVVTYDDVAHFDSGGRNRLQIQLYKDGRIVLAYSGISALTTGSIVGLSPGPGAPSAQVNYSQTPQFQVAPNTSVHERFTGASPFDLDSFLIEFVPLAGGGYRERSVNRPPAALVSTLTGGLAASLAVPDTRPATRGRDALEKPRALTAKDLANAEVIVRSSRNPRYIGMTNADAQGRFVLQGVPAGGIEVLVRRKGVAIARGAGVYKRGGKLNQAELLHIELFSAELQPTVSKAR